MFSDVYLFDRTALHLFFVMMMALSSQARIVGKVDGQLLHAWWLWGPILDAHPSPHFGQTKVGDEDGWDVIQCHTVR